MINYINDKNKNRGLKRGYHYLLFRKKTDLEVLLKQTDIETEVYWDNRIYKTNKFPIKLLNGNYGVLQ